MKILLLGDAQTGKTTTKAALDMLQKTDLEVFDQPAGSFSGEDKPGDLDGFVIVTAFHQEKVSDLEKQIAEAREHGLPPLGIWLNKEDEARRSDEEPPAVNKIWQLLTQHGWDDPHLPLIRGSAAQALADMEQGIEPSQWTMKLRRLWASTKYYRSLWQDTA